MLTSIFTKSLRDRWIGMAVAVGLVSVWLVLAMAVYREIDISVYTDLPAAIRDVMGIPEGADSATLAYNVMLDMAAPLTLAGMAISMGSAAVAGEERNGTIGVLLGNPKTRTELLVSKLVAMLVLVIAGTLTVWGSAELAPVLLDVDIGGTMLGSMHLHLAVNTVFYGVMALAVGAWTGNRSMSSSVPALVLAVSYFATGLLPLVESVAWSARLFPWYYYASSDPLSNGIHWVNLALLAASSAALFVVAFVGVNRRDLQAPSVATSVLDRLRNYPATAAVFDRLAGTTRVSRIWVKTTSEHQALLLVTSALMFSVMGVLMGPMYTAIEADISGLGEDLPEAIMAIAGGGDLSSPEGWFQVESFSLMAPAAVMVVTIVIGARSLAGEEANRRMGLLLANPISRSRVVAETTIAMVVYAATVGGATFVGVVLANIVSRLDMSVANIAATSLLVTLLGLLFGAVALALSAAIGRTKIATYGTIGVAATSHLLNSFLQLSDELKAWARLTPHHYYLSSDPLRSGMDWGHAAVLVAVTGVMVAIAAVTFERRDLYNG